jgi:polyferredoxin
MPYQILADAVLAVHVAIVVFVVGGLVLILVGNRLGRHWVNRRGFRYLHLLAIGVVVLQAWLGVLCPLTTLEMWLRAEAGEAGYTGSFVQHWLKRLLYYEAPPWVFIVAYSLFGLAVLFAWWKFPPGKGSGRQ